MNCDECKTKIICSKYYVDAIAPQVADSFLNPNKAALDPVDSQSAGSIELLRELMDACSPYLRRKKMTPRHECSALKDAWAKGAEHLEKQNR